MTLDHHDLEYMTRIMKALEERASGDSAVYLAGAIPVLNEDHEIAFWLVDEWGDGLYTLTTADSELGEGAARDMATLLKGGKK